MVVKRDIGPHRKHTNRAYTSKMYIVYKSDIYALVGYISFIIELVLHLYLHWIHCLFHGAKSIYMIVLGFQGGLL
jgi:hypothetical protein